MGAVAGPSIVVQMLTAMEHDLQYRVNHKMDTSMMLSMRSIFLGQKKSDALQKLSQFQSTTDNGYAAAKAVVDQIENQERQLQAMEKQIEMQINKLNNELKQVQQRKEGAQKMLDQNIKSAFSYGQG